MLTSISAQIKSCVGRCRLDRVAEVATFEEWTKLVRSAASAAGCSASDRQFVALLAPILHALDASVTAGQWAGPVQAGPRCLTLTTDRSSILTDFNNGSPNQPPPRLIRRLIRFVFTRENILSHLEAISDRAVQYGMRRGRRQPLLTAQHQIHR